MRKIWLLAMVVTLSVAPFAKADSFTYDISGALSGSFTVSGTPSGGSFEILSGALTASGFGTFALYDNPSPGNVSFSPSGAFLFDDLLFPGASKAASGDAVDIDGLLFVGPGGSEWNLWGNGDGTYTLYEGINGNYVVTDNNDIFLTETPEPSSLLFLGSGLVIVAVGYWRRTRRGAETAVSKFLAA
jgi:hypothetical protein